MFLVQVGANVHRVVGIYGTVVKLDVLNNSLFVYDDVRALRPLVVFVLDVVSLEDAVVLEHFLVHVAEKRELDVNLLCKSRVGRGRIHAYAKNCRIVRINLTGSESSLDRLKLLRSTACEGENVHGEEHVLFAAEVRKLYGLPLVAEQVKIGSLVTDFQSRLGNLLRILRIRWNSKRNRQRRSEQE